MVYLKQDVKGEKRTRGSAGMGRYPLVSVCEDDRDLYILCVLPPAHTTIGQ